MSGRDARLNEQDNMLYWFSLPQQRPFTHPISRIQAADYCICVENYCETYANELTLTGYAFSGLQCSSMPRAVVHYHGDHIKHNALQWVLIPMAPTARPRSAPGSHKYPPVTKSWQPS